MTGCCTRSSTCWLRFVCFSHFFFIVASHSNFWVVSKFCSELLPSHGCGTLSLLLIVMHIHQPLLLWLVFVPLASLLTYLFIGPLCRCVVTFALNTSTHGRQHNPPSHFTLPPIPPTTIHSHTVALHNPVTAEIKGAVLLQGCVQLSSLTHILSARQQCAVAVPLTNLVHRWGSSFCCWMPVAFPL